jgi:hypothetical protein
MFKFIKKALDIIYNKKYKVKATSSIELIFFMLTCSALCVISYKIYYKFKNHYKRYEKFLDKQEELLDKKLEELLSDL